MLDKLQLVHLDQLLSDIDGWVLGVVVISDDIALRERLVALVFQVQGAILASRSSHQVVQLLSRLRGFARCKLFVHEILSVTTGWIKILDLLITLKSELPVSFLEFIIIFVLGCQSF